MTPATTAAPVTRRKRDERGSMAVEIVILVPILFMFAMLVVAGGRFVSVEGDVQAAARDAARAASLEKDYSDAHAAAGSTIAGSLDSGSCRWDMDADWRADGTVQVEVTCEVSYAGLGLIGLPGSVTTSAESHVRLDPYREFTQ